MYTYVYIFIYLLISFFLSFFLYLFIYTHICIFIDVYIHYIYTYLDIFLYLYRYRAWSILFSNESKRFLFLQFSWPPSGYSTQPTSMMQFSTKNEWMAQGFGGGPMSSNQIPGKEGFQKNHFAYHSQEFCEQIVFFLDERGSHGLADSDSPCKLFLRDVFLLVDRYVVSRNLSWWWLPTPHHLCALYQCYPCRHPHHHRPFYHLVISITFVWHVCQTTSAVCLKEGFL